MKKKLLYLLWGYFILQLVVPGYFVYRHYDTLQTGESLRFEVVPYDPYDPFRGRYVRLSTAQSLNSWEGEYALLTADENGYARVTGWSDQRPDRGIYAKNLRLDRYYMNEKQAPETERLQRKLDYDVDTMVLTVRVKNGNYVIEGLFLNDIPIEQYLEESR